MDFVVTLNGAEHTISAPDPALLAAISGLRQRFNQKAGLTVLETDAAYVQKAFGDWAVRNVGFSQGDLDAVKTSTFASWVNQFYAPDIFEEAVVELTGDALKNALKGFAANKRWQIEMGGMTSQTFGPLLTDRETRGLLGDIIQSIDLGITAQPVRFKAPSGFVSLDRAALIAIAAEVAEHVKKAFDTEDTIIAAIDAGTISTTVAIDAYNWS